MADFDVCYKKCDGAVIAIKPNGWPWSDYEKGVNEYAPGKRFAVFTMDMTMEDALIACCQRSIDEDNVCLGCVVNNIDNPTAIEAPT